MSTYTLRKRINVNPAIEQVNGRSVVVKEECGVLSVYGSWKDFFARPDADELCVTYLKKLREQTMIVTTKLLAH